jgi:hypothetical protein
MASKCTVVNQNYGLISSLNDSRVLSKILRTKSAGIQLSGDRNFFIDQNGEEIGARLLIGTVKVWRTV